MLQSQPKRCTVILRSGEASILLLVVVFGIIGVVTIFLMRKAGQHSESTYWTREAQTPPRWFESPMPTSQEKKDREEKDRKKSCKKAWLLLHAMPCRSLQRPRRLMQSSFSQCQDKKKSHWWPRCDEISHRIYGYLRNLWISSRVGCLWFGPTN